jgi:hypothetical protein
MNGTYLRLANRLSTSRQREAIVSCLLRRIMAGHRSLPRPDLRNSAAAWYRQKLRVRPIIRRRSRRGRQSSVAVLAVPARLALTTARLLRPIRATRLRAETMLVLNRRVALRRRVRMRTVRARARRGTISIRQRLRVRRLRGPRTPRAGVTVVRRPIVRRRGSLVRRVHLVRRARPLRVRVVRHNGRLRLRHSAVKVLHRHSAKVRHRRDARARHRRDARARLRRNGRKLLRSINLASENQWMCSVASGWF